MLLLCPQPIALACNLRSIILFYTFLSKATGFSLFFWVSELFSLSLVQAPRFAADVRVLCVGLHFSDDLSFCLSLNAEHPNITQARKLLNYMHAELFLLELIRKFKLIYTSRLKITSTKSEKSTILVSVGQSQDWNFTWKVETSLTPVSSLAWSFCGVCSLTDVSSIIFHIKVKN